LRREHKALGHSKPPQEEFYGQVRWEVIPCIGRVRWLLTAGSMRQILAATLDALRCQRLCKPKTDFH